MPDEGDRKYFLAMGFNAATAEKLLVVMGTAGVGVVTAVKLYEAWVAGEGTLPDLIKRLLGGGDDPGGPTGGVQDVTQPLFKPSSGGDVQEFVSENAQAILYVSIALLVIALIIRTGRTQSGSSAASA